MQPHSEQHVANLERTGMQGIHPQLSTHPAAGVTKSRVLDTGELLPSGRVPTMVTSYCRAKHETRGAVSWLHWATQCTTLRMHTARPTVTQALTHLCGWSQPGEGDLRRAAGHNHWCTTIQGCGSEAVLRECHACRWLSGGLCSGAAGVICTGQGWGACRGCGHLRGVGSRHWLASDDCISGDIVGCARLQAGHLAHRGLARGSHTGATGGGAHRNLVGVHRSSIGWWVEGDLSAGGAGWVCIHDAGCPVNVEEGQAV
jgi:hypothetical protein